MFDPSRDQARDTFLEAWRKYRAGEPVAGIGALALEVVLAHPEYHALLSDPERSRDRDFGDEANPFLHMSLHLAFEEQLSIDQPPGIVRGFEGLLLKTQDKHDALHEALECLAETLWRSQRDGVPPDAAAYLDCLVKRALR
jgi:hypothetical protein